MRLVLTICLVLLSTVFLHAQYFNAGLMFGVNGSQITGDDMRGFNKGGILTGTFVEHDFEDDYTLRMEINYTQKGSRRLVDEFNTTAGKWNLYRLSYVEVPIMVDKIIKNDFGATAGLALGFSVYEFCTDRYNTDIPDFTLAKPTETSILIGGTYQYSEQFEFFLRYQSSLFNFSTAKTSPFWPPWGVRKRGLINVVVSIGVRYYLGKK